MVQNASDCPIEHNNNLQKLFRIPHLSFDLTFTQGMEKHEFMEPPEIGQRIMEDVTPRLQELGVSAFILVGYAEDGEGKVKKLIMGFHGNNPAYADGLRPMQQAANYWVTGAL